MASGYIDLPADGGGTVDLTTGVTGILPIANGGTNSSTQNFVDLTTAQNVAGAKNLTSALTVTQTSATTITAGPNGSTNPVLQVDSSTASQATGIKITGLAAAGGAKIESISSAASEDLLLVSKGSASTIKLQVAGSNRYSVNNQAHGFAVGASIGASTVRFAYTGASDTSLTASTEAPNVYFDMGQTRQHATGALSSQRDFRVRGSTHSFVGASTITNAAALSIDGPSSGSTNATITNSSALWVPTSAVTNVTNSYGLNVNATTGATTNYAAIFNGGWVGIGTAAPLSVLNLQGFHNSAAETVGLSLHNSTSTSTLPAYGLGLGPTGSEGYMTYRSGTAATSVFGHKWFVNDVEIMRVRGDGKVGINNAAPVATLDVTGNHNILSASSNSFTIGPNGSTNPVLQIDSSVASQAAGLKITGNAAAAAVTLASISGNSNEGMNITTKGSGQLILQVGGSAKYTATATQNGFTQAANTAAATARFLVTGAADTSLTASTEAPHTYFNIGQTRQHATGAIALQRDFRITPSIHTFVGASVITDSAAFSVDGPANASTNATVTNSSAIYVPTSAIVNTTNSYGINIAAATGATNNYAGIFTGGNVGIGTVTPTYSLDVAGVVRASGASSIILDSGTGIVYSATGLGNSTTLNNGKIYTPAVGPFIERNVADANPSLIVSNLHASSTGDIAQFKSAGIVKVAINNTGSVGVGIASPNANAILDVTSTTKAFMPPRMTTTQKNAVASPTSGMIVYDSTLNKLCVYGASAWETVTSS